MLNGVLMLCLGPAPPVNVVMDLEFVDGVPKITGKWNVSQVHVDVEFHTCINTRTYIDTHTHTHIFHFSLHVVKFLPTPH